MNITNPVTNAINDRTLVIDNPNPRRDCLEEIEVQKIAGIVE